MSTWQKITSQKPRLLAWFLRLEAAIETLAFVAVVMPHSWMAIAHRWLGLGELPDAPLLDYMIRSVSFLYGLHGVLLWILATDTIRFRPLIIYGGYLFGFRDRVHRHRHAKRNAVVVDGFRGWLSAVLWACAGLASAGLTEHWNVFPSRICIPLA